MPDFKDDMPVEMRRRKLLAEGALLRMGIMEARATVRANLNPESLAKSAVQRMAGSVAATVAGLFSGKGRINLQMLQSLSPYLLGGISLLSKRRLRKPLLYGGIVSVGAALAYYLTRRSSDEAVEEDASVPMADD
jgi:hypothetical protein